MLKALENSHSNVRERAAKVLGRRDSETAVAGLLKALENPDPDIRWSTVETLLANVRSKAAVPALLKALEDQSSSIRERVAKALGEMASEATVPTEFTAKVLKNQNSSVRGNAAESLGAVSGEAAVARLLENLEGRTFPFIYTGAAKALLEANSEAAVVRLLKAFKNPNGGVRRNAAEALGIVGDPSLIAPLWQAHLTGRVDNLGSIAAIQNRCKFYNYEIAQSPPLPEEINRGNRTMSEKKVIITGSVVNIDGTFHNPVQIGTQHNHAPNPDPNVTKALNEIKQVLEKLAPQTISPHAADVTDLEVMERKFDDIEHNNPSQWETIMGWLSIIFAGGVETIKVACPPAGIPLEVGIQLHKIYTKKSLKP